MKTKLIIGICILILIVGCNIPNYDQEFYDEELEGIIKEFEEEKTDQQKKIIQGEPITIDYLGMGGKFLFEGSPNHNPPLFIDKISYDYDYYNHPVGNEIIICEGLSPENECVNILYQFTAPPCFEVDFEDSKLIDGFPNGCFIGTNISIFQEEIVCSETKFYSGRVDEKQIILVNEDTTVWDSYSKYDSIDLLIHNKCIEDLTEEQLTCLVSYGSLKQQSTWSHIEVRDNEFYNEDNEKINCKNGCYYHHKGDYVKDGFQDINNIDWDNSQIECWKPVGERK